jgi:hypothetical protein
MLTPQGRTLRPSADECHTIPGIGDNLQTVNTHTFQCEQCGRRGEPCEPAFLADRKTLCRACKDQLSPTCPTCGEPTEPPPPDTRGKCSKCSASLVLDPDQWLYPSTILTEQQARESASFRRAAKRMIGFGLSDDNARRVEFDAMRSNTQPLAVEALKSLIAKQLVEADPSLEGLDMTIAFDTYERARSTYWKAGDLPGAAPARIVSIAASLFREHGHWPDVDPLAEAMFREAIECAESQHDRRMLLFSLAMVLANTDRDYRDVMHAANLCDIDNFEEIDIKRVEVMGYSRCRASREMEGKRYSIKRVRANPPIPSPKCDADPLVEDGRPWCRCIYGACFD